MKRWICLLVVTPLLAQDVRIIVGSTWSIVNGKKVQSGETIPALAKLTASAASDLVLDCGKDGWLAYSCNGACTITACGKTAQDVTVRRVDPYGWAGPKPTPSRVLESSMVPQGLLASFFSHQPKNAQVLGVRAAGNLSDAVVRQAGDKVLWAPALARVLEGNYCFQIGALPAGSSKPRVFALEWNREGDGGAQLGNLAAGLYTIERGTPGEKGSCQIDDPDAAKAWVLVVGGNDFERIQKEWESYAAGLRQLAEDTGPEVASTVSHAVLAALADSAGK
jgi:hypothetical protein